MKNEDIDKLFRDHVDKLDIQPSTDIWKKIEMELDEQKIVPIKNKINWLKPLLATATLLLCVGIFNLLLLDQAVDTPETKNIVAQKIDNPIHNQQKERVQPDTEDQHLQLSVKDIRKTISNKHDDSTLHSKIVQAEEQESLKKITIAEEQPLLVVVNTQTQIAHAVGYIPLKPLIENTEEEDSMMASTNTQTVVTKVLNILSKTINQGNGSEVQFSNDDEGTLQIDLLNSLVKNKKRKK